MKNISWDALELFIKVARFGGLSAACNATGLSPATVGRRMLDLEGQVERKLFRRSRRGYSLTADGEDLLAQLLEMEGAARKIENWRSGGNAAPLVRIACGTWIGWLLMQHIDLLRSERDRPRIHFEIGETRAAVAFRESDLGIRAFEPNEPNLAAVALGEVAYAPYRSGICPPDKNSNWIAVSEQEAMSAYLRYPHETFAQRITLTVTRPRSLYDLVIAGAGIAVLPCLVGDKDERLARAGPEISELRHRQWLVMNNDDRHRREIRLVADRVIALIKANAALIAGERYTN
ncbi:LysR family transcriptional regulator [Rhizobium oryzicola]|uniref:LysR family transcriptional regulator n=1 Tax=Rhizobium oryzicola TaxID=1232668 RepID=A0ABT8SRM6_9HYPH|nr:LysR family transcriptional regulator [Rhizobium oryzicola]MDO1581070.1 LysR family transcriptional regulator [Rhizobium oryzicola]